MKTVIVPLKQNKHEIVIGHNILSELGARIKKLNVGRDALIITNPVILRNHGRALIAGFKKNGISVKIIEVPAGERSKSARVAFRVIEQMARYDVYKKPFIVAFGGGVVGDLAGYVAAAYKRGIPYIQVPTTLLAQVDSAIGGKVAIDLSIGKNLVGAFYQPKLIWSDVAVLSTLDKRQIRNGLAEIIKYGVIADRMLFNYIIKNYSKIFQLNPEVLSFVVERSSRIKTKVVLADERETKDVRAVLNFGHTIGHAIEAAGKYRQYHHGEAIALGMRVAAHISGLKKLCSALTVDQLDGLITAVGLPERIQKIRTPDIFRHMKHDKKFLSGKNRFVLMVSIGKVKICEGVSTSIIRKAIQACR